MKKYIKKGYPDRKGSNNSNYKHGLVLSKEYNCWFNIKSRCYNKNHEYYEDYGGRGIKMFEEWINNKYLFIEYIRTIENYDIEGYSIDRIDNNGNYEPGNIKFSTSVEQNKNRREQKKIASSGYRGIYIDKRHPDTYQCRIRFNKKEKHLGSFNNIEDALNARNKFIILNNLKDKLQY